MAASPSAMEGKPESGISELIESMEHRARDGQWEDIENLAVKLRAAVMLVPAHERREALLAAGRSLEAVRALALEAKDQVTEKLSAIRRGKDAAKAYAATD